MYKGDTGSDNPTSSLRLTHDSPVDGKCLERFMSKSMIALDGLWFMNVLEILGEKKTLDIDIRSIAGQFKLSVRLWRRLMGLDGKSPEDKAQIFFAISRLYGHQFEVVSQDNAVTLSIFRCGIYENLKAVGRADEHDCSILCSTIASEWFREMEPRTDGKGEISLLLPKGGVQCRWTIFQPEE